MEKQFTIPPLRPVATMKKAPEVGPFGVIDTMRYESILLPRSAHPRGVR